MTTATRSPNGVATGFIYRRQWIWIEYPAPIAEPEPAPEPVAGVEPEDTPRMVFRPNPDYGPRIDEDGNRQPGFAVRVLANPNGGELRQERELWDGLNAKTIELDDYLREMAWRVREWRAYAEGDDGTVTPIPAPGECPENDDQWQAFYAIPEDLMYWVVGQVRIAYLLRPDVPKARTATASRTPSTKAGTTATPIPTTSDPAPEPPPS